MSTIGGSGSLEAVVGPLIVGALKSSSASLALVDARGLASAELRLGVQLRPNTFIAKVMETPAGVELKPGEEVEVPVEVPQLAPNANIREVRATLTVMPTRNAAPTETRTVSVTTGSDAAAVTQAFGVTVNPPATPQNVQVRLDRGQPIWSHGGALPAGDHDLGDFAEQANAYLDAVSASPGAVVLRFLVRSDAPGRVRIAISTVRYTLLQTQTWPNPLDGSLRIDRTLDLDFGALARIELGPLVDPPDSRLVLDRVMADVTGEVGPDRLLGDVPSQESKHAVTVNSDYAVAQQIRVSDHLDAAFAFDGAPAHITGVAAAVRADAEVELYAEIRENAANRPADTPSIASRIVTVAPANGGVPAWTYVAFEQPADIDIDRDYWVVLRGVRGRATLALTDRPIGYLKELRVNRGGQTWRSVLGRGNHAAGQSLAAAMRLVYAPAPDTQSAAVEVGLEDMPAIPTDPGQSAQRLTLFAGRQGPAAIVVASRGRGTLTLANVVQEFALAEDVSPR